MLFKTFSRSLLAIAVAATISSEAIEITGSSGSLVITNSEAITIAAGGAVNTGVDGISLAADNLDIPFIHVDQGGSIDAGFNGVFFSGTGNTVGEITIAGSIFLLGLFNNTSGVKIDSGNTVTGDITFSPTSVFGSMPGCDDSLFFCDGLAVISTTGTHTGDILLQGTAVAPVGIQLAAFENSSTGEIVEGATARNIVNSGTLTAGFGVQVLSGSTVNGDVRNDGSIVSGVANSIGIIVSSERFVFDPSTGRATSIVAGEQVNINGSILNAGTLSMDFKGISVVDNVLVTGNVENSGSITGLLGITASSFGFSGLSGQVVTTVIAPVVQGDIVNTASGLITTTSDSIRISDGTAVVGSIINRGQLESSANRAIGVFGNSSVGAILNDTTGTIDAGDAGIKIDSSTVVGSLTNAGIIGNSGSVNDAGIYIENSSILAGVFNSGAIAASDAGINVDEGSNISGGVNNSGTVSSSKTAIEINGSAVTGGINNSGDLEITGLNPGDTIEVLPELEESELGEPTGSVTVASISGGINNQVGARIQNSSAANNFGTLVLEGGGAAILLADITLDGGINNDGSIISDTGIAIRLDQTVSLDGVALPDMVVNGGLNNTGTISAPNSAILSSGAIINGGITNSGVIEGAVAIAINGTVDTRITTSTPITVNSDQSIRIADGVASGLGVMGDVNNSGTLRSTFSFAPETPPVDFVTSGALSLSLGASIVGDVNNTGSIVSVDANGIIVGFGGEDFSGVQAFLQQFPTIGLFPELASAPDSTLISPPISRITGVINNTGTISSDNSIGIYINHGSVAGIINAPGATISGGNGMAIRVENAETIGLTDAPPSSLGFVSNAGLINGSIDFGGNGGTFNGIGGTSGAVIGASILNIQLSNGALIDTQTTINGDLTFSGAITVDAKGLSLSGANGSGVSNIGTISGVLSVVGVADVSGSTLAVNVTADNFIADGAQVSFLEASSSLISDIALATDNSAVVDFTVTQQGSSLIAIASRTAFEEVIADIPSGGDANIQSVSQSLTAVSRQIGDTVDANSELAGVANSITALATPEQVVAALKTLEPEAVSSAAVGSFANDGASAGAINTRMANLRGTGFSGAIAGDDVAVNGFWLQLYNSDTEQETIDDVDGFDANTYGMALGIDAAFGRYNVGMAISYADSDIDSVGVENNSLDIESYRLTGYASYFTENYYIDGQVSFARNQYDSLRNIFDGSATGLQAVSDHDGDQYSLRLRVGKPLNIDNGFVIQLKASAEYTYLIEDKYSEKNAGNAGLTIDTAKVDAFVLGAGIDVAYPFVASSDITWVPEMRLELQYDFIGDEVEVDSNFIGVSAAAFSTKGANVEQTGINAGMGLRAFGQGGLSVTLQADYLYKKDYKNVSGSLNVNYIF